MAGIKQILHRYSISSAKLESPDLFAAATFSTLGYTTDSWDSIPHIDLESELDDGHILLVRGSRSGSGHAWVLDGYTEAEYYEEIYHISGNTIITDEIFGPLYTNLYHINWGWYGMNNGYFAHNVFNPKKVIFPDGNINFTDRNYSIGVKFLRILLRFCFSELCTFAP